MSHKEWADDLIAQDAVLAEAWNSLKNELRRQANIEINPAAPRLFHMEHGPSHWNQVLDVAEQLWHQISIRPAYTAYATPKNVFILRCCAYLHDVSCVTGDIFTETRIGDEALRILKEYGVFRDETEPRLADTTLGQLIRRERQKEISLRERKAFSQQDHLKEAFSETGSWIEFILAHYTKLDGCEQELNQLAPNDSDELMALAAVFLFADWAQIDRTRIVPESFQLRLTQGIDRLKKLDGQHLASASFAERDGGDVFSLPILFRSYYVVERQLLPDPDQPNTVKFTVRLLLPNTLKGRSVVRQLARQWRNHIFPSRMTGRLAGDFLEDHANLTLHYKEPILEFYPCSDDLIDLPNFVQDYFCASQYYDLSLLRQFQKGTSECKSVQDFLDVKAVDVFTHFKLCLNSGYAESDTPSMPRAVLLAIHSHLTYGHNYLAHLVFRMLAPEVLSIQGRQRKVLLCLFELMDAIEADIKGQLVHGVTEDELRRFVLIAKFFWSRGMSWREPIKLEELQAYARQSEQRFVVDEDLVRAAVRFRVLRKLDEGQSVSFRDDTVTSALFFLRASPLKDTAEIF
ncbi:MAG: hypothetical protein K0U74_13935 [Alphaproteobacteria bacterium]|nr:hypothetical protein [Alphaproteobacteria bacterium]